MRGITQEMVIKALSKPDKVGMGYDDKNLVFKKFLRGVVKIVFVKKKNHYTVVSVIWHIIK